MPIYVGTCQSEGMGMDVNDSPAAPDSDFDGALGKETEEVEVELDDH